MEQSFADKNFSYWFGPHRIGRTQWIILKDRMIPLEIALTCYHQRFLQLMLYALFGCSFPDPKKEELVHPSPCLSCENGCWIMVGRHNRLNYKDGYLV